MIIGSTVIYILFILPDMPSVPQCIEEGGPCQMIL